MGSGGGELIADGAGGLTGPTKGIEEAEATFEAGGLPASPGLYAWWMQPGAVPGVSGPMHPTEKVQLLYVGIAPSRPSSSATLRSRVVGQHVRGNIGASTFRLSLAAL